MSEPKSLQEIVKENVNEAGLVGLASPPALPIWAYNVLCLILVISAAYIWLSSYALEFETFKADNAHGATANAAERVPRFIAGGSLLICAFLCRVIVAIKRLAAK